VGLVRNAETKERTQDSFSRAFDRLMAQYEATGLIGLLRPRDKRHAIQLARRAALQKK